MKPLFFICGPRTRSSILFETMAPWSEQHYGLLPLKGHTELFLETSANMEFLDSKTNEKHEAELYPIAHENELRVHYIWPHVLKTREQRNLHKLEVLEQLRKQGKNYNIKGTMNIVATPVEVIDFFSDRHFVITKRRNMEQNAISLLYAFASKLFHAKSNNLERYKDILNEGVHISQDILNILPSYFQQWEKLNNIESLLDERGLEYTVVYYEEMNTQQEIYAIIDRLFATTEWRDNLPDDLDRHTPILLEKNYRHAIHNYDQVAQRVREYL